MQAAAELVLIAGRDYVENGERLGLVFAVEDEHVWIEDAVTGDASRLELAALTEGEWRRVERPAVTASA